MDKVRSLFAVLVFGLVTVPAVAGGQLPEAGKTRRLPPVKVAPNPAIKHVALTYPRRGHGLHKGIGYKVTWVSLNLKESKMKIELLNNQETEVIRIVGTELDNTGQMMWYVDNLLPDQETFYKLRIQTMDGAKQHTVGPFKIFKGAVPPGVPKLTVTNPPNLDRAAGDVIPVRWTTTTTCNTSQDGPVRNEIFLVEQLDLNGKTVAGGMQGPAEFIGESPTGYLNWQRNFVIGGSPVTHPTYRIRVTSRFGFTGDSPAFRVVVPTAHTQFTFPLKHKTTCFYSLQRHKLGLEDNFYNLISRDHSVYDPQNIYTAFLMYSSDDNDFINQYVVRSRVFFHDDDMWYRGKGDIQQAKLIVKRAAKSPWATFNPCLSGVVVLTENPQPACIGWESVNYSHVQPPIGPIAPLSGVVAVNSSTGDTWEVDLTEQYRAMVEQGKRDGGIMLVPGMEQAPDSGYANYRNAETYRLELRVIFAKKQ